MDNIHADHELDVKTAEAESDAHLEPSNLSRARTATLDWPGLADEPQ